MDHIAVVDTNVISYLFRNDTRGLDYVPILESFDHLILSFQTMAELDFWSIRGKWGRRRRADLAFLMRATR
ncbi:hypothetical protein IT570_05680 [Candidatus Sumerlaeota bacterium]|nr:hypothetical protein [Candidatus Sumerlaeota bacterium]